MDDIKYWEFLLAFFAIIIVLNPSTLSHSPGGTCILVHMYGDECCSRLDSETRRRVLYLFSCCSEYVIPCFLFFGVALFLLGIYYIACSVCLISGGVVNVQQRRERIQMQEEAVNTAIIQETEEELQQINKSLYKASKQKKETGERPSY